MNKNKSIILLSGGLDSYIALNIALKNSNIILALNFNYGQKAFREENCACKKICKHYGINLKTIKLPFLKELCKNALTDESNNKTDEFSEVWVPNRNGLFLNVAACYCERLDADFIIIGANKEESVQFSDNSSEFIKISETFFKYSTQKQIKVYAPCKNMSKVDIINYAIDNDIKLEFIKSCYDSEKNSLKKHCGKCMSCKLLYNAIMKSKKPELTEELF